MNRVMSQCLSLTLRTTVIDFTPHVLGGQQMGLGNSIFAIKVTVIFWAAASYGGGDGECSLHHCQHQGGYQFCAGGGEKNNLVVHAGSSHYFMSKVQSKVHFYTLPYMVCRHLKGLLVRGLSLLLLIVNMDMKFGGAVESWLTQWLHALLVKLEIGSLQMPLY